MSYIYHLAIPSGDTKDANGRELGEDWLLMTLGSDDYGTQHYLTTDHCRAGEYPDVLNDPTHLAELVKKLLDWVLSGGKLPLPQEDPYP